MTMDVWFARDCDGRLHLHFTEPVMDDISGLHWQSFPYTSMINVDNTPFDEMLADLKPTDKPVKMKIKL